MRMAILPRLGSRVRIPSTAPVDCHPNFSPPFPGREKAQLPRAFARKAWGFGAGTLRQIALRMALSLRSLGLGPFTLEAFLSSLSEA